MGKLNNCSYLIIFLLLAILMISACDSGDGDSAMGEQDYPSTITIGAGSQGGAFYILGGGFSNLLEEHLDVTSNVEATGGPVHNIQLLGDRAVDFIMTPVGPLHQGYFGEGDWVEEAYEDLRIMLPMYYGPFHWWSLESSGVTDIYEHQDERVGIGSSGGTSAEFNKIIYETLGIQPSQQVEAGASDLSSQMVDGLLSHMGFHTATPVPALSEVEAQRPLNIYGINGKARDKIIEELSYFEEYTIPSDAYDSLEDDLDTIAMYNYGVTHKDINEEFVYDFVKAYHENIDQMVDTHGAIVEAKDPENILNNEDIPLHSGAIRYYEEIGLDIPDYLYPEEYEDQ